MPFRKMLALSLLSSLLIVNVYAQKHKRSHQNTASAYHLPPELIYKGKPVDSLCFFEVSPHKPVVSLKECGVNAVSDRRKAGANQELASKGYIGYDYIWPVDVNNHQPNCYSYYKLIGHANDTFVIYAVNGTGGSGDLSNLFFVKRVGDSLYVKSFMAGDRCNGGISKAKMKGPFLTYNTNLTAFDFINLSGQNPYHLKDYDDLASCAACCAAKATYVVDLGADNPQAELHRIDLGKTLIQPNKDSREKYQFCFDSMVARAQAQKERYLDQVQLESFMQEFYAQCVKR